MKLSILIVNYNTEELTIQAIDSVIKYVNGLDYEIIVIANNQKCKDEKIFKGNFSRVERVNVFPLYLIAILSDGNFTQQGMSIFDGSEIINNNVSKIKENLYKSKSYKIGNFLLYPFRIIKSFLKQ